MSWSFRDEISIEGLSPERALLRLRRAGIPVYDARKVEKNRILLRVDKKDTEKVFAIYPNVCYNGAVYSPYVVKKIGAVGLGKTIETLRSRVGLILGGLLFLAATTFSQSYVYGVEFTGSTVYAREAAMALEEGGIAPFQRYESKNVDLICSKILSLDGVEFCSVKKTGSVVKVEIRTNEFAISKRERGEMRALRSGTLLSLTVLCGTPLKKAGETIQAGEPLVGNYFKTASEEKIRVEVIARARIACEYEAEIEASDAESAFAQAYLALELGDGDEITEKSVTEQDGTFHVKIRYTAVEKMNL
ncbi:MAG: sporulation protein YqfD [Clostridia bacterium]|nr:sporulation protein YqfD [Clostridia bacterium]